MGTWMATIQFPDGSRKYLRYSTNVEEMFNPVYSQSCPLNGTLPDGEHCYRATPIGEPDPSYPDTPLGPLDDIIPVVVTTDSDPHEWHALFSPRHGMVLGPRSPFHSRETQETYELIADDAGVRHLCEFAITEDRPGLMRPNSICELLLTGPPLPYYKEPYWLVDFHPELASEDIPYIDLYAQWGSPDLCRTCLVDLLLNPPRPEPTTKPEPSSPPPQPRHWLSRLFKR
ncbi:hypothetical protein AB0M36_35170 [Actinoplanes sp. NPDC051346]|uniref:hypothetical protein n=1 Tax=Actinoplanes sp. NPDC051346 TaxID=3155048 RepID=UPI0034138006